jgi:hypothetical protein
MTSSIESLPRGFDNLMLNIRQLRISCYVEITCFLGEYVVSEIYFRN